jgi:hypothetical protein
MKTDRKLEADDQVLRQLGYEPELARRMSGFSNFAISLSIICILAGGITSFHVGLGSVGGASLGVGWPVACLFSLAVAATMAQVASAFPTAGGLYHWASILGGRGCGWATAWFNLAGLITVLATVNAGTYDFALAALRLSPPSGSEGGVQARRGRADDAVAGVAESFWNSVDDAAYGPEWMADPVPFGGPCDRAPGHDAFPGLVQAMDVWELQRGTRGGAGFPRQESVWWLFALGLMLPAYTITGFDASAHTAEETVGAAVNVPKGIVRSVWVSGLMGWGLVVALTLAMPSVPEGVAKGAEVVPWILRERLSGWVATGFLVGILLVQYLCGLAALTSASRMAFCVRARRRTSGGGLAASGEPRLGFARVRGMGVGGCGCGVHRPGAIHDHCGGLHRVSVRELRDPSGCRLVGMGQELEGAWTLASGSVVSALGGRFCGGFPLPAGDRSPASERAVPPDPWWNRGGDGGSVDPLGAEAVSWAACGWWRGSRGQRLRI